MKLIVAAAVATAIAGCAAPAKLPNEVCPVTQEQIDTLQQMCSGDDGCVVLRGRQWEQIQKSLGWRGT